MKFKFIILIVASIFVLNTSTAFSEDKIQIVKISPSTDKSLHIGQNVIINVEVIYNLESCNKGYVNICPYSIESNDQPENSPPITVNKGMGKLILTKEIQITDLYSSGLFIVIVLLPDTKTHVASAGQVYHVVN